MTSQGQRQNFNMALCQARHDMPACVQGAIFPNAVNPTDLDGMQRQAITVLQDIKGQHLTIFVTGLTVALVTVLNVCRIFNIQVTLMHFDRDTNDYFPQVVL